MNKYQALRVDHAQTALQQSLTDDDHRRFAGHLGALEVVVGDLLAVIAEIDVKEVNKNE